MSRDKTGDIRSHYSRASDRMELAIKRLVVKLNALRRHPLDREKRREFRRSQFKFESTRAIESVHGALAESELKSLDKDFRSSICSIRGAADTYGNAIISRETGEWIGHKELKFLNEVLPTTKSCVKALDRYVAYLRNVTVIGGTRYLLTDDGRILHDEEAIHSSSDVTIKYARARRVDENMIQISVKPRSEISIPAGVHLMVEGDTNYFHFVVEILPRLMLVDSLSEYGGMPLLITGGLHENLLTALATVNDTGREIIELEPDVPYQVEDLIYPSDTARILNIYGRRATKGEGTLSVDWLRRVRASVIARVEGSGTAPGHRRLYVRRGKKMRALVNEAAIEEMLIDERFEIVDLDDLSFRVQVKLFAAADLVVMPTGAAVTNVMWCKPGAQIMILTSDHPAIQHNIWQLLCEASESELTIMRGPRANKLMGEYGVHDDFEIDVDVLRSAVQSPSALQASDGVRKVSPREPRVIRALPLSPSLRKRRPPIRPRRRASSGCVAQPAVLALVWVLGRLPCSGP